METRNKTCQNEDCPYIGPPHAPLHVVEAAVFSLPGGSRPIYQVEGLASSKNTLPRQNIALFYRLGCPQRCSWRGEPPEGRPTPPGRGLRLAGWCGCCSGVGIGRCNAEVG